MSGFNMPPGVSPSDIPGNRPEDDAKVCPACGWDDLYHFREYDAGTLDTAYDWCPECNWRSEPE